MAVSGRYTVLAAAALALLTPAALADCANCGRGPVRQPPVTVPAPQLTQPGFVGGGPTAPQAPGGCANRCGPGLPSAPNVFIPTPTLPGPNITVVGGGHGGHTLNVYSFGGGSGGVVYGGGGGGVVVVEGGGGLGVSGGAFALTEASAAPAAAVTETRTVTDMAAIRAICLDDGGAPHPASQTFAGEAVPEGYRGEIFRCMAGTAMSVALGSGADGRANFDGARTLSCAKGEALTLESGAVRCQAQEARRPCNERSLLRRFGPGIKLVSLRRTETVTRPAPRPEPRALQAPLSPAAFDGGVGQGVGP